MIGLFQWSPSVVVEVIMGEAVALKNLPSYFLIQKNFFFTDIDECSARQAECSANAVCHNLQGSYSCSCKEGYYGDGKNCTGYIFFIFIAMATSFFHQRELYVGCSLEKMAVFILEDV